jgi:hypothetical protein
MLTHAGYHFLKFLLSIPKISMNANRVARAALLSRPSSYYYLLRVVFEGSDDESHQSASPVQRRRMNPPQHYHDGHTSVTGQH